MKLRIVLYEIMIVVSWLVICIRSVYIQVANYYKVVYPIRFSSRNTLYTTEEIYVPYNITCTC